LHFLFAVWPYVAAAAFALGCLVRGAMVRLQSRRSDRRSGLRSIERRGSRLVTAAWLLLFVGHAVGIVLPGMVLAWNAAPVRLYTLEGLGFAIGLAALGAWLAVAGRSLNTNRSVAADIGDSVFLGLVFVGVLSGLLLAAMFRWASAWGVATLSPYLVSIAQGAPRTQSLSRLPFLVQLHVVSAFGALAVFPVTTYAESALGWVLRARRAKGEVVPQPAGVVLPSTPESEALPASVGQGVR
jgi:nitrate reductase gamma subunit